MKKKIFIGIWFILILSIVLFKNDIIQQPYIKDYIEQRKIDKNIYSIEKVLINDFWNDTIEKLKKQILNKNYDNHVRESIINDLISNYKKSFKEQEVCISWKLLNTIIFPEIYKKWIFNKDNNTCLISILDTEWNIKNKEININYYNNDLYINYDLISNYRLILDKYENMLMLKNNK